MCPVDHKKLHYGDWLYAKEIGFVQVNDVMGAYTSHREHGRWVRTPITHHLDIWVSTLAEEKAFHKKHHSQPVELYEVEIRRN